MVFIGKFFFKYRNWVFILLYAALLIPSPPLFTPGRFGIHFYLWPLIAGIVITCLGQLIRGLTIGLAYIVRGGKKGNPYAEGLVTDGMFNHCRNPLYIGNILMLIGVGILANSLIYVAVVIPIFLFIYQAIVLAEENFLRGKFGIAFDEYCRRVNRWRPNFSGFGKTFTNKKFNWKRWILKEHTTQFTWLVGITLILFINYPQLTGPNEEPINGLEALGLGYARLFRLGLILGGLLLIYLLIRYLKKTGKFKE